jgi:hypothetical protein
MPDISKDDDGGFIIAKLKTDFNKNSKQPTFKINNFTILLDLSNIESFYPLSDRGKRLLSSEVENFHTIFEEPIFEKYWELWINHENSIRNHLRGMRLANSILDLDFLDYKNIIDEKIKKYLSFGLQKISANPELSDKPRLKLFNFLLRFVNSTYDKFISNNFTNDFNPITQFINSQPSFKKFFVNTDLNSSVFTPINVLSDIFSLEKTFSTLTNKSIHFIFYIIVFYYIAIIESELKINIPAMLKDIAVLEMIHGPKISAYALYLIGSKMSNAEVTTLYYYAKPQKFPILKPFPKLDFSLDLDNYINDLDINDYESAPLIDTEKPSEADDSTTSNVKDLEDDSITSATQGQDIHSTPAEDDVTDSKSDNKMTTDTVSDNNIDDGSMNPDTSDQTPIQTLSDDKTKSDTSNEGIDGHDFSKTKAVEDNDLPPDTKAQNILHTQSDENFNSKKSSLSNPPRKGKKKSHNKPKPPQENTIDPVKPQLFPTNDNKNNSDK